MKAEFLRNRILDCGARSVGFAAVEALTFSPEFREICRGNGCGMYGRCWMCPPEIGAVEDLIRRAKGYRWAAVYEIVGELQDSFDFDAMMETGRRLNETALRIRRALGEGTLRDPLYLGAGGCHLCEICAKAEGAPCRHPDRALAGLEAYGIDAGALASLAGLDYYHGKNTVTYFGAVLLHEELT